MIELVLFLKFGLALNVLVFLFHFVASLISAVRLGAVKIMDSRKYLTSSVEELRSLRKKYEPINYFFESLSIFIPFYFAWLYIYMLITTRFNNFFELPIIAIQKRIVELKNRYES